MSERVVKPGDRFGKLTALESLEQRGVPGLLWFCRCDCGGTKVVKQKYLKNGSTKSCGCLRRERGQRVVPNAPKRKRRKPQLCWGCRRASEGARKTCPWSSKFQPVDGWTAVPVRMTQGKQSCDSYEITACPLFLPDQPENRAMA